MKTRRLLAAVLVLCMVLCCMSVTALAAEEQTIALGESKTVTVSAHVNEFSEGKVVYSFTPAESGTYVFSAGYHVSEDMMHMVALYIGDGDGEDAVFDRLIFEAEAGQTYELNAEYFGLYTESVDYIFCVEACLPLEGIELVAEAETGTVEEYLYVDVIWQPSNSAPEEITWASSDTSVVDISYEAEDFAELYLAAPGKATITAATASGLTASVEITVEGAAAARELFKGENAVTLPGDGTVAVSFAPEASGYYTIDVDSEMAGYWFDAEAVIYDGKEYYRLEAGKSYEGELYGWREEKLTCTVTIAHHADLVILEPVAIEIVKLPHNTTYLKDTVHDVWRDDMLSGLELKVTWSDNSVSNWSYDEENGSIGTTYVGGLLSEKDSGYEIEVYVGAGEIESARFDLTVLDMTVESVELVDDSPLQIVEYSCGMDLSQLGGGWYYLPFGAYLREVTITLSDGSTVNAMPGDVVYGVEVTCYNNQGGVLVRTQPDGFWTKDSENLVRYCYGDLYALLTVEIVDSPVESIELVTLPEDTFMVDEEKGLINRDGDVVETARDLLDGMSLKVNYKNGTSKTFAPEDIEWRMVMDMEYPFIEDYPIGVFGGGWLLEDIFETTDEIEGYVEYKGVSTTYTINLVEKFENEGGTEKPGIEINPESGDDGITVLAVVALIGVFCTVVMFTEKKKLF